MIVLRRHDQRKRKPDGHTEEETEIKRERRTKET